MKQVFGVGLLLVGIVAGVYVGFWECFVGGLMDIVQGIINLTKNVDVTAFTFVWGAVKILFAGFFGWLSAIVFILPALALMGSTSKVRIKIGKKG
jgi:hypothetical protein